MKKFKDDNELILNTKKEGFRQFSFKNLLTLKPGVYRYRCLNNELIEFIKT